MKNKNSKKIIFHFALSFCALIFAFCVFTKDANAATLYFSPSKGNFTVGNLLTTSVLVNTQEAAINNSDATINFPAGLLEVVSVSKAGSIFSLWVEEPAFSNSAGTITFNGGLPTPGFNGTAGKIVSIAFRVKSSGSASLIFSSAAVRANDGYGTDVLQARAEAQFNLVAVGVPPAAPPAAPAAQVPLAPKVSSETHPDSVKWYANNDPSFNWTLTKDITGVNVLADRNPTSNPGTTSDGMRTSYTFKDVDEGEWYFHIRLRNSAGWGAITHFKFNVDTVAPEIVAVALKAENETDPRPILQIKAEDETSGLDRYDIGIDGAAALALPANETGEYQLPAIGPGEHKIIIKAFDKAGNASQPYELSRKVMLLAPVITDYSKKAVLGGKMMVYGKTIYPDIKVFLRYQKDGGEPMYEIATADASGNFAYELVKIKEIGLYKLWAEVVGLRGAKSNPSNQVEFIVQEGLVFQLVDLARSNILWLIFALIVLILLIIIILYIRSFVRALQMLITKEEKVKDKKKFYASKWSIESLLNELEKHAIMIDKLKKKRRLSWKEKFLRRRYRKLAGRIRKYMR